MSRESSKRPAATPGSVGPSSFPADVGNRPPANYVGGFRAVAIRVSCWTTNLLVSAVVVLISLLLGGRLIALWRLPSDVAPTVRPGGAEALGVFDKPGAPLQLDFGETPLTVSRQVTGGNRDQALEKLLDVCARQMATLAIPTTGQGAAEKRLLQLIRSRRPLQRPTAETALYQLDQFLPVTVGTLSTTRPVVGTNDGQQVHRVVLWGLAAPAGDGNWHLYTFCERDKMSVGSLQQSAPKVAVPVGADHLLTISADRQTMVAFQAAGNPQSWPTFYDEWFEAQGWRREADWQRGSRRWLGRYRSPDGGQRAEVMFSREMFFQETPPAADGQRAWRGLITMSAANLSPQKSP